MAQDRYDYGFIGAGKMATALIRGLIESRLAEPARIIASDPAAEARRRLQELTGVMAVESNRDVVEQTRIVLIAVHPQVIRAVLEEIKAGVTDEHIIVSVAAGVPTDQLLAGLGGFRRVVRVMPNTPALVGCAASAYCLAGSATEEDGHQIERLLAAVGRTWQVDESLMDAVTGLSGSGPAYAFVVIEALSDGGVRMGLPRATATALAAQTLLGAAEMVLRTGLHPGQLKDQVASPGGTTIAGLHALECAGLRAALIDAVQAATLRCRELAEPASDSR